MISGRPENSTTTTGMPAFFALAIVRHVLSDEREIAAVADHLGIRRLADHDHRDVGALGARAVRGVGDFRLRCGQLLDGAEHRGACGDRAALALPLDRPAAALVADVVGAHAGHVDALGASAQSAARCARSSAAPATRARPAARRRGARREPKLVERLPVGLEARCRAPSGPSRTSRAGCASPRRRCATSAPAVLHERLQRRMNSHVLLGHHHHVHAGVDRLLDLRREVAGQLRRARCSRR